MNQSLSFDGKTYISVSRASKKFGYTADYVGQLCRAGKIDARMIGRTWYVEWESIKNHKKTKKHRIRRTAEEIRQEREGLSFSEITKLEATDDKKDCPPEEYLANLDKELGNENIVEIAPEKITEPILNLIPLSAVIENKKEEVIEIHHTPVDSKQIEEALPIKYSYDVQESWLPKLSNKAQVATEQKPQIKVAVASHYNPALAIALGAFIFLNAAFAGINLLAPQMTTVPIVRGIESTLDFFVKDSNTLATNNEINTENISSIYGGIKGVWNFIFGPLETRINHFAVRYMNSLGFAQKTNGEQVVTSKTPINQGLVVLPDDKDHQAKVASIKKTFSDEVQIKEDADSQSGVIIPKFREADGEGYTYVLIPIDSP
jgi:hypothetical protein